MDRQRKFHANQHDASVDDVFVFGSNLSGIHGGGAAAYAHQQLGAQWRVGVGMTGRCYALPTKNFNVRNALALKEMRTYVEQFLRLAAATPEKQFFVSRVGCGLAGFEDRDIGPMFAMAPLNCVLPPEWKEYSDIGLEFLTQRDNVTTLVKYAYEQGFHEMGFDPVQALLDANTKLVALLTENLIAEDVTT